MIDPIDFDTPKRNDNLVRALEKMTKKLRWSSFWLKFNIADLNI